MTFEIIKDEIVVLSGNGGAGAAMDAATENGIEAPFEIRVAS